MRTRPSATVTGKRVCVATRWGAGVGAAALVAVALSSACVAAAGGDRLVDVGGFRLHIHCTGSGLRGFKMLVR
jgi:hypothetical protein